MKRVLVIGSSGAMGQYLVPKLAERGYRVDAVSLAKEESPYSSVNCICANVFQPGVMDSLLLNHYDGIVDFMVYGNYSFSDYADRLLAATDHYIYLSSGRIYANEETPVRETSPRLLDVSCDADLLASNDYCIHKAKGENLLRASSRNNWTIVRPATTYSYMRYQLVTLEAPYNVGRAFAGKKAVVPYQAKDKPATLSWGSDVAEIIARLLFLPSARRETYNVATAEHRTWAEIAEYYKDICGLESVWIDKEEYLNILSPGIPLATRWQLEYARMFDRITDNSKVLQATGMKQTDLISLYDGLKYEISRCPKDTVWGDNGTGARMDAYLAEHGL